MVLSASAVLHAHRFGHEGGALLALDLHGHLRGHPDAVPRHLVDGHDALVQPDARAGRYRVGEANLIGTVVETSLALGDLDEGGRHAWHQGEGQIAVGDRLALGHLAPGPLDVDVDPLVIAGGVGELVDHGLLHRHPLGRTELFSHVPFQVPGVVHDERVHALSLGRTSCWRSSIERIHVARGCHSWAMTRSVPKPPASSRRAASLAATVGGSPTIQMLSQRYSRVTLASDMAGSVFSISKPRSL